MRRPSSTNKRDKTEIKDKIQIYEEYSTTSLEPSIFRRTFTSSKRYITISQILL